jgi:hypothetical protein
MLSQALLLVVVTSTLAPAATQHRPPIKNVSTAAAAAAAAAAAVPVYKQATAPIAARVADLLAKMTTQEKVNQLLGDGSVCDPVHGLDDFLNTSVGSVGCACGH